MKNRYTSILFIFLSSISFEFFQSIKLANAEEINKNFQKENFSVKHNSKNYFKEKNQNLINNSFYANGYTFEESLKLKNQILDLFGISFKNKNSIFGFPEQRIESDAFSFWITYEDVLRNQIPKNAKFTNDLDNGFGNSLLR
tara:strand:+ start:167 stop:592 length:426 start_codon:yes stop_codon:yes gene_type:complete